MTELEILKILSNQIELIFKQKYRPVRVAINGIEGTGKTVFANKLTQFLNNNDKKAIHVSIDGFHFNKEHRYKQGRDSAKGYYEDSYDEVSFVEKVLVSSQKEAANITTAIHDLETDQYLNLDPIPISNDTILITDGAYLFKPNYIVYWDLKIYLKTDFSSALSRGINRDFKSLGGFQAAKEKFDNRYHKASKIYIEKNRPEELADIVINNTNFEDLKIEKTTANTRL